MGNIYTRIPEIQSGEQLVLATVTGTSGSTPQKPGSSAVFDENGLIFGTVGGGATEGEVTEYAKDCIKSGKSAHLHFQLNNDISKKDEPICGGEISVLVDARPLTHRAVFNAMAESLVQRIPGVLVTMVTCDTASSVLINRYWFAEGKELPIPEYFRKILFPEIRTMISSGNRKGFRQFTLAIPGEEPESLFILEAVFPEPHLVIAGAGHIGRALSHLGKLLDFEVTVMDDRSEYANRSNLPDADNIIVAEISKAISEIRKDLSTYIVIVTRGHSDDANALRPCIGSEAAYVGMIGSKPKVAKMRREFIDKGYATEEQWAKINTPIGLEINSQTVNEIAVSIAAQLVQVRNKKK